MMLPLVVQLQKVNLYQLALLTMKIQLMAFMMKLQLLRILHLKLKEILTAKLRQKGFPFLASLQMRHQKL